MAASTKATGNKTTALVKWKERLAERAQAAKAITKAVVGKFIGTRAATFTINGKKIGSSLSAIVVRHTFENAMYEGKFDPDNPSSPVCFAIGDDYDELKPHELSTKPQHEQCAGCPNNEFGSADTGRGKACRNVRRLALIAEDAIEGDLENTEVHYLRTPVTSSANWDGYVNDAADKLGLPPFALVTEITLAPDPQVQMIMTFKIKKESADNGLINNEEQLEGLDALFEAQADKINFPYQPVSEAEKKPANKFKAGGGKFGSNKPSPRPANQGVTRTTGRR